MSTLLFTPLKLLFKLLFTSFILLLTLLFTLVFDSFILGGWKAIIKIGMALLKYNEYKILNTPIEELLNYLTNDIIKSQYFAKDNVNEIMNASIKFKINGIILEETEKQFHLKKGLPTLQ